jgi:hypothetical protein
MSLVQLRTAAIDRTRREVESLMTSTATILRDQGANGPRGWVPSFQPVLTTKCLLTASVLGGGTEDLAAGGMIATMTYTLTVPSGTDINASDRALVEGTTFEVKAVKRADTWGTSDSAILVEFQG